MSDIVTRLRVWSSWLDERVPDTEVRNDLREAANEIERLREQVTAAHESHGNEVGALTERLSLAIHERDEARRWVCQLLANPESVVHLAKPGNGTKRDFAAEQGWDCFKEGKP